jgi:hypothetical protein
MPEVLDKIKRTLQLPATKAATGAFFFVEADY